MTWFRMEAGIGDHEIVGHLAEHLKIDVPKAVGHLVLLWAGFADYRPDGRPEFVTDTTLEEWAKWRGKRGRFAAFVRSACIELRSDARDAVGVLKGWWRQEALLREQERNRRKPGQGTRRAPEETGLDPGQTPEGHRENPGQTPEGHRENPPVPFRGNVDEDEDGNESRLRVQSSTRELSSPEDTIRYAQRCTAAANRGLRENGSIAGFNELVASAQDEPTLWHAQGIPIGIAEQAIFSRAKAYRPKGSRRQPTTLGYFRQSVEEAWSKAQGHELEAGVNTAPRTHSEPESEFGRAAREAAEEAR